ncbi:unnamed protein product [Tilletia laevis]|uniref:Uncharacterized protein n=2 Tax=Tilletia TaxID=13289 RepID=A0A177UNB9_9BASI|nr:hypothetical protein CF336_g3247 [Tilletia laevis]KAE8257210.1 hypothetical protein A4X03_0g4745 [Tilletia caries]KAE8200922.1 hypothetical protein CF335_g3851 [Tilletia laevis]CAD6889849.1 unnamed protein product [Tilletia caries]CAD6906937.1 unnamed protein product [Tilletia caries]
MSLRDSATRKIPARFADSDLGITSTRSSPDPSLSTVPGPTTTSAGVPPKTKPRSGSPVTPGPPADYIPQLSGEPPAPASAIKVAAAPPLPAVIPASPSLSSEPSPPAAAQLTTEASADASPQIDISPDCSENEEDPIKIPPSAQRPRAKNFIPARPQPDPASDPFAQGKESSSSNRRVQPDRNHDFFDLRRVRRNIEDNPPEPESVVVSDSEHDSDEDYAPAPKKKSKDPASAAEEDKSEEEELVDLTGSSPVSPSKSLSTSPIKATLPAKASSASKSKAKAKTTAKTKSSTTAQVTGKTSAKGKEKAVAPCKKVASTSKQAPEKKLPSPEKKLPSPEKKLIAASTVTITPEEALERAQTVWRRAHDEATARMKAESGNLAYTPPSNPASKYYLHFNEPYLKAHIDPGRDETGIAFNCRCCPKVPYVAWRALSDTSTSLLKSHVGTNKAKTNLDTVVRSKDGTVGGPLERYLIRKPDSEQVAETPFTSMQARTIAVAWVTKEARPISILGDKWFREFLPECRRALIPSRNTTTQDISDTYEAMQAVMRKRLAAIHGCIHLALDIWTSPNGHSYVGVIGCWQEDGKAQRNVLDMVPITKRHTAVNISAVISALMKRLELQEKVWFIASDNSSTNTAMMQLLGKDDSFPRIEGEATQIRCIAHILNLVSEAILRPFNQGVKASGSSGGDEEDDWESEEEEIADGDDDEEDIGEIDPLEDNDMAVSASLHPSAAQDKVNEALIRRALTTKKVAYISASASSPSSSPPATSAPQPSADLRADSGEVGIQIKQLAWFARKLRYNGRLRGSFQETCALFKLKTPYSLIRDVATRWNSTLDMVERALVL